MIGKLYQYLSDGLTKSKEREWSSEIDNMDADFFKSLVSEFESLAIDYALQQIDNPIFDENEEDDWLQTAYRLFRFQTMLSMAGEETLVLWKKGFRDRALRPPSLSLFVFPFLARASWCLLSTSCRS